MLKNRRRRQLRDAHRFTEFRPGCTVTEVFGDPKARVIALSRRSKKRPAAPTGESSRASATGRSVASAICRAATPRVFLDLEVRRVDCGRCRKVKQEKLGF